MNTLIISGGDIETDFALNILKKSFTYVIGVDGGVRFCYEQGIALTHMVGDFDTLDHEILDRYKLRKDIEIREFDPVKDATDTQIAVELAVELGSEDIVILGGTGTRMDHVLGNIQTLYLAHRAGVPCRMVDPHNRIRLIEGSHMIRREEQYGKYFSLIPFTTDVEGVTLRGVKYPLWKRSFTVLGTGSFGVSNEITGEQAEIFMEKGIFVLIESKD